MRVVTTTTVFVNDDVSFSFDGKTLRVLIREEKKVKSTQLNVDNPRQVIFGLINSIPPAPEAQLVAEEPKVTLHAQAEEANLKTEDVMKCIVKNHDAKDGITVRELAALCNISQVAVYGHLRRLMKEERVKRNRDGTNVGRPYCYFPK